MSCFSTATATGFATLTSTTVLTSFSNSVTSLKPSIATVQSCMTADLHILSASNCVNLLTIVGGGESTVQVPVLVTRTLTETTPTTTKYGRTCDESSTSSQSATSTDSTTPLVSSLTSTTSVGSPSSSTSAGGASNTAVVSTPIPSSTLYTTTLYETSLTTLPGGSVIPTQVYITDTVVTSEAESSTTTSSASSTTASNIGSSVDTNKDSHSMTPSIIGAIVGGIAALVILAFIFSRFWRGKRKDMDMGDNEDAMSHHELLRKRGGREKGFEIDAEPRPFTTGPLNHIPTNRGNSSRGASSTGPSPYLATSRAHTPPPSTPMLRTPIPSHVLPLHDIRGGARQSHLSSATPSVSVHSNRTGPPSRDGNDIRRAVMHVTNELTAPTPPPLPSKYALRHAEEATPPVGATWSPYLATPVAGGSTMRMPEAPNEPNRPFVPANLGDAPEGSSSAPRGKAVEAASDMVQAAEPPPPAYSA